jgi:hypothetical protein
MFRGLTIQANLMKIIEYKHRAPVMFGEMYSGDFVVTSLYAANGNPQLATGPQKC